MVCRACGVEHGPLVRCEVARRLADREDVPESVVSVVEARLGKTGNRRSRADYNAYQREYMRKWRVARKAGKG